MTRTRALVAIVSAAVLIETVSILGMAALGITGGLLSLGAIVPLVLASYSSSLVIMRFGPYGGRDGNKNSDRR
jgi:hypothetical protein